MTVSVAKVIVVAALLLCCNLTGDSFCIDNQFGVIFGDKQGSNRCHSSPISFLALHTSAVTDSGDGNDPKNSYLSFDELPGGTKSQNPFLPLLSSGLRRVSLAMDKSTSDQLFLATSSLQRLRQQIVQLTKVGPSSLGERAGLGLFASKNIKAGTIVGFYPAHALGYELVVSVSEHDNTSSDGDGTQNETQDFSMFLAANDEDTKYFREHPHGDSPYLHATDQPLFQRLSLLSPLFDEEKKEIPPPLYLDVNPNRNHQLDPAWRSHYINDGASLLDSASVAEDDIEQYYIRSSRAKNCIHVPFGPSPVLATVTTKKVKKGDELFTTYGVVYWAGAIESASSKSVADSEALVMTEKIHSHIIESARDLQKAMDGCRMAYANEMVDFENALHDIDARKPTNENNN